MLAPLPRHSILSVSGISGDKRVADAYSALVHGRWGVVEAFDACLPRGAYGEDLDLILFMFHVEGSHAWFRMPERITLGRYSAKEKSVGVNVPMFPPISEAVRGHDDKRVQSFLVDTFGEARRLLLSRKSLIALDFDVGRFNRDYDALLQRLASGPPANADWQRGSLVITAVGPHKVKLAHWLQQTLALSRSQALALTAQPCIRVAQGYRIHMRGAEEQLQALGAAAEFRCDGMESGP